MRVILGKTAGFCFGVNRAVELTYSLINEGKKVCTLGPIIHNTQVIEDLGAKGVVTVDSPSQVPSAATVVVRAHGVGRQTMRELEATGAEICDATCPFVKKIHSIVADNSAQDIPVLIAGDSNHPEVQGIMGYCRGQVFTFGNCGELENLLESAPVLCQNKTIVVSQTTFSQKEWEFCKEKVKIYCTNANIFDTICFATEERQKEAAELSARVDMMIIVGGRHSSNTVKLQAICSASCETHLVERADELLTIDFSRVALVGVMAGASTPATIIKEVLLEMSENLNETIELEETATEEAQVEAVAAEQVEEVPSESKSFDEMDFSEALEASLSSMSTDQKVKGVVMGFTPSEIQVDIGRKHAGFVPVDEYSADPSVNPAKELKIGDTLDLIIMKTNDAEGTVMLSKRRFDAQKSWIDVIDAEKDQRIMSGKVIEVIKGGVLVITDGVRVFIPASLATERRDQPLEELLNTEVQFRVIEVNQQRRRAVGSIRSVLRDGKKEASEAFWATAEVGTKYHGTVKSMTSYGAFVDIGGIDGMVHISELSWKRIKDPSEVLSIGDEVDVYIKALDPEKKKISLGYKNEDDNPWEVLKKSYPVGTVLETEIVGMTTFGAFAKVIPGIDGLIHISQIADHRINKPQDVLKVGEQVTCKITAIDFDKRRVSLSIRALLEPVEDAEEAATAEETAPVEEAAPAEEAAPVEEEAPKKKRTTKAKAEEKTDEVAESEE